ncbi:MAG TPA: aspartate aminotransferase family protein [Terriglobales bacterium]|nr:aspartate aminotransferase family protein [Terriglobales bacterium]
MDTAVMEVKEQSSATSDVMELEKQYLLGTYARFPVVLEKGKGVFVQDVNGKKYLDLVSGLGVNALGYAHPRIVKVIREQSAKLVHVSNLYYNQFQGPLAKKLVELSGLPRVFFSNTGTEAIDGAIKFARAYARKTGREGKFKLVAATNSFHGRTYGGMSLTATAKYRDDFKPLLDGVTFVPLNDIGALREAVTDDTCAVFLETVQGEGGIFECSADYLHTARQLCTQHHAALVLDEIQCGLGRTGEMFAFKHHDIVPDILTLAKPIAGGLPLGAILVNDEIAASIGSGKHGTTFGGGPLACRVALEYLAIVEETNLIEHVRKVGSYFHGELTNLLEKFSIAKEVRGRGLMLALELNVPSRPYVDAALAEGVLMNSTHDTTIRFLPPFIVEEKHIDKALKVLKKVLKKKLS